MWATTFCMAMLYVPPTRGLAAGSEKLGPTAVCRLQGLLYFLWRGAPWKCRNVKITQNLGKSWISMEAWQQCSD